MKGLVELIQAGLSKLSEWQLRFYLVWIIVLAAITLLLASGWFALELESDFSAMNPQGLPITKLTGDVDQDFGELESVLIAMQLDESIDSMHAPTDMRNPEVLRFLERLHKNLADEVQVQQVTSPYLAFPDGVPNNQQAIKQRLSRIPEMEGLISSDYSMMLAIVSSDLGADSAKITKFNDRINEIIAFSAPPPGVTITTTGETPLGATIFNLMINDAVKTSLFALALIFLLLLFLQGSVKDALVILIPLGVGISWTFSLLGLLEIPINIGSVGLSAMLIGLGVEYNIFLVSRFKETRPFASLADSLKSSLTNIGASILSSGGTTMIGFFALATSVFPILSQLGLSLGLGIFSLLAATILVTPLALIVEDKLSRRPTVVKGRKFSLEKYFRMHGKAVSRKPGLFIMLAVLIFAGMVFAAQDLNNQDMDFETILPQDLPAMSAYRDIQDEWGDTTGVDIYLEVMADPYAPEDIRDPEVLSYIDRLGQQALLVEGALEADNIAFDSEKDGKLPATLTASRELLAGHPLISDDARITIIDVEVADYADRMEVIRQLQEVVDNSVPPPGVRVEVIGGLAVQVEQDAVFGPDSTRTSLIALAGILIFLFLLTRSWKGTFLPITTVILSVVWTIGLIGLFRVPFNNITSSVITMTIGIGIDFGIQLLYRYKHELQSSGKRKAMEEAITHVFRPMLITVVAAVIGFRAMTFGDLNIMGDLGSTMSFAMIASMAAALTGVAGLMVVFQKKNKFDTNQAEPSSL